jgi:hypothetical protein
MAAPARQELNSLAVGAGGTLAVAGGEGTLLFWDRRTGGELARFEDTHAEAVTQVCEPSPLRCRGCCRVPC